MTGGIATLNNFNTTTPFTNADSTNVGIVLSGGSGTNGDGVVDTSGGNVTSFTATINGSGYVVGDTVTLTEDGGSGVATAEVATLS